MVRTTHGKVVDTTRKARVIIRTPLTATAHLTGTKMRTSVRTAKAFARDTMKASISTVAVTIAVVIGVATIRITVMTILTPEIGMGAMEVMGQTFMG